MMEKFIGWFSRHRTTIGYTIGGLNILSGIADISAGDFWTGIFFIVLGLALIVDAKVFK